VRVLLARPSDAEASLAFAGLIDLFDGVATSELCGRGERLASPLRLYELALDVGAHVACDLDERARGG